MKKKTTKKKVVKKKTKKKKAVKKQALYKVFEPISSEKLGLWSRHVVDYDQIVGFSSLGHIFLRNQSTSEYIVLHPFKGATKSYDKFSSVKEFEKKILKDPVFSEYVLRPGQVDLLNTRLGPLEGDQIYIPQPIPLPGGIQEVQRYAKGDIWRMMDVIAEMYVMSS